ncbi:nuclear transport factor 2 family protein [Rhizorhabdus argentea]|uniref:nuclear transport factor 2 family protein n=1 Tax=Rhizorhabdus argentea TaxID=1387174 RepID=UPI0030EF1510
MESAKKQAVRQYCDAVGRGDAKTILSLVTEDYTHEFLGSTVLRGTRTLSQILEQLEAFSSALVGPGQFTFHEMVEEGDLVAATFSGKCELVNGKRFDGDYAAFIHFRGDKILMMRELIDTKLADSVLA